ncbi:phenylalanine 4-monooxygenase [Marinihelvus fidelis]|uniref:phenylalanine 4-monooxygenase n=1 Tax=Marinihelvus fidelis TaxID=2613842 RepID=A0A5N0TEC7_9GAMM|nr:phenylalanine 4-monooxygenase [Marinihelvus fidelis]KAA9133340.1 phenylalanine 4-monooxygenase [Marinihelvus fidelis]
MGHSSRYTSKQADANGVIDYSEEENRVWGDLMSRQLPVLPGRVCDEYQHALELMNFPRDRVPQLAEISAVLQEQTGWSVAPVPALIDFTAFFKLLANRQFPAATFIRRREDMDYLQEPDIFHELFGHTPLLTDYRFAAFTEAYGNAGLAADRRDHAMLARLFWFTVEFGLINTADGLRSYGAGLVSSPGELTYSLDSEVPQRRPFDPIDALRTPYRIDIYQTVYFVIDSFDTLYELAQADLAALVAEARRLGMHAPTFPQRESA